jgi:hypothetical protein
MKGIMNNPIGDKELNVKKILDEEKPRLVNLLSIQYSKQIIDKEEYDLLLAYINNIKTIKGLYTVGKILLNKDKEFGKEEGA